MPLHNDKEIAPSNRELDILKIFCEIGEASVRDVHSCMSPNGEFAFTTIQKLTMNPINLLFTVLVIL